MSAFLWNRWLAVHYAPLIMLVGVTLCVALACTSIADGTRDAEVNPDSTRVVDVATVDEVLESAAVVSINKSPAVLALAVARELPFSGDCRSVRLSMELHGGKPRAASAVVIVDMCSDDSQRSRWYEVIMSMRDGGSWEVDTVREAWSCWPERGHEGYSAIPCD